MARECFVYLLAMNVPGLDFEPIKIGVAVRPKVRARTLNQSSPFRVRLVEYWRMKSREMALAAEHALHRRFDGTELKNEWFNCNPIAARGVIEFYLGDIGLVTMAEATLEVPQVIHTPVDRK